jgi:hypothetical protein
MMLEDRDEEDKSLDALMLRVLVFVDNSGKVVNKESSPMHSTLTMKYKDARLNIKMHVAAYAQGNGSCSAFVKYRGKKVFSADGCYTAGPWSVKAKIYKKGEWEKLVAKGAA